jgi:hypothetical protein
MCQVLCTFLTHRLILLLAETFSTFVGWVYVWFWCILLFTAVRFSNFFLAVIFVLVLLELYLIIAASNLYLNCVSIVVLSVSHFH